ncbi:cupredoxin domain-containing protein [Cohnella thermotolerans]|uniref:cupredoxin domain-containing protein n=1 Tax=Cohnella thermotolerans TaxID=329858 RepID=UPI00041E97CC|nr:cupredoxin domain-containing protein [Cohnella thermotolerans]
MKKWSVAVGILLMAAWMLSACGGGNDNKEASSAPASAESSGQTASGGAKEITVEAKNFEFDQKEIKVAKGDKITIKLNNAQGNHSLKIEGYDQEAKGGQSVTFTADKAGEFKFYCNVMCGTGHGEMTGKLIVE